MWYQSLSNIKIIQTAFGRFFYGLNMLKMTNVPVIGGTGKKGIWMAGAFTIGVQKHNDCFIDLTSDSTDPRIKYTGPPHFYWDSDGHLHLSDENEWPVEYKDGLPIGRHAPEPAAVNLQPEMRGDTARINGSTGNFIYTPTSGYAVAEGPDGGPIASVNTDELLYGIYDQTSSAWLEAPAPITDLSSWTRVISTLRAEGAVRTYVGRRDTANYLYALCQLPVADTYTFSHYRKLGSSLLTGFVQVEAGTIATSPILTGTDKVTRNAATAIIATAGINRLTVSWSDGASDTYQTPEDSFSLPLSAHHWGTRYMQSITLEE
ncbi:hypothetical protein ABU178_08430 [Pantoea osteomyelitidis]|uniref:Tail fiber protein n=1 Tax=Pantoea osteomyelitidis TaxID=3230026 RepID=A0ABW7PW52_9GAMM